MSSPPEELRRSAEKYCGSAAAADDTSYERKALAAQRIQDCTYGVESLIPGNARWPMTQSDGTFKVNGR